MGMGPRYQTENISKLPATEQLHIHGRDWQAATDRQAGWTDGRKILGLLKRTHWRSLWTLIKRSAAEVHRGCSSPQCSLRLEHTSGSLDVSPEKLFPPSFQCVSQVYFSELFFLRVAREKDTLVAFDVEVHGKMFAFSHEQQSKCFYFVFRCM